MSQSPAARRLLVAIVLLGYSSADVCCGAVALDALGLYLSKEGYGGAQLVHPENFYYLPIQFNGKRGNLLIDTGAPASLIFRQSLKTLGLTESKTKVPVSGAFGSSRQFFGLTTIKALTVGNCTLTNVPVTVARGTGGDMFSRSRSNGLLGLRELIKFGAVLDLPNRLVYLRPSRPSGCAARSPAVWALLCCRCSRAAADSATGPGSSPESLSPCIRSTFSSRPMAGRRRSTASSCACSSI